jgi:chromosome segregation ATPase
MSEVARMLAAAENRIEILGQELQQAQALSERQKARLESLQATSSEGEANVTAVMRRLEAEVSRLMQYVDEAVEPLARAYQLEHVQKQIEKMREDVQAEAAAAAERMPLAAAPGEPLSPREAANMQELSGQQVCPMLCHVP